MFELILGELIPYVLKNISLELLKNRSGISVDISDVLVSLLSFIEISDVLLVLATGCKF